MTQNTFVIVSGALFSPEGKLLLLRKAELAQEADCIVWELPGGRLDFGESPELGLVRCFLETTALDISVDRPLSAWSFLSGAESQMPQHHVHIDFMVRNSSAFLGVDIDSDRHAAFTWATQAAAAEQVNAPAARASVQRAFLALARTRKNL